jgi:hypothetical protein
MTTATLQRRTVPLATLGEFMADLDILRAQGWEGVATLRKTSPTARFAEEWLGPKVRERYLLDLYRLATAKADEPQTQARPKRPRTDALNNERRMRNALLRVVKSNGWTGRGTRELARIAGMNRETARHVLARMEADGQVEVDRRESKRGKRHGFRVVREHPAWSECEKTHPLALSEPSSQVRVRKDPPLSTGQQGGLRPPARDSDSPLGGGSSSSMDLEWKGSGSRTARPPDAPATGPSSPTGSGFRPTPRGGSFHPMTSEYDGWLPRSAEEALAYDRAHRGGKCSWSENCPAHQQPIVRGRA